MAYNMVHIGKIFHRHWNRTFAALVQAFRKCQPDQVGWFCSSGIDTPFNFMATAPSLTKTEMWKSRTMIVDVAFFFFLFVRSVLGSDILKAIFEFLKQLY